MMIEHRLVQRLFVVILSVAITLLASPGPLRADNEYQCEGGPNQAVVNACAVRWAAANVRAHIAARIYGGATRECLAATATLLEHLASTWLASNHYKPFAGPWPCGSQPRVSRAADGLLAGACPNSAWSYTNKGDAQCLVPSATARFIARMSRPSPTPVPEPTPRSIFGPPATAVSSSTFQCRGGDDESFVNACAARWEADNLRAHLVVGANGASSAECLANTVNLLEQFAEQSLTEHRVVFSNEAWPCGSHPVIATSDDYLAVACPGNSWTYQNRGISGCTIGPERFFTGTWAMGSELEINIEDGGNQFRGSGQHAKYGYDLRFDKGPDPAGHFNGQITFTVGDCDASAADYITGVTLSGGNLSMTLLAPEMTGVRERQTLNSSGEVLSHECLTTDPKPLRWILQRQLP